MKNLNLNDFGVQEMNAEEMRKTDGGLFWEALAIALIISAIDNFGDIREGFADGYNGTPRHK